MMNKNSFIPVIVLLVILQMMLIYCRSSRIQEEPKKTEIEANREGQGPVLYFDFRKGSAFNHPSFAIWAEDMEGNYIQTLFISKSVGRGVYEYGDPSSGQWKPDEIRRPASLPYWAHKRNIKAPDGLLVPSSENPVPDAYTGATPSGNFGLLTRFDASPPDKFRILFEINQTWDWNEYWTNNKFPDNEEYKTSCQPALVYMVDVNLGDLQSEYELKTVGHSHYAGENGKLFNDLSTLTTALQIVDKLTLRFI